MQQMEPLIKSKHIWNDIYNLKSAIQLIKKFVIHIRVKDFNCVNNCAVGLFQLK